MDLERLMSERLREASDRMMEDAIYGNTWTAATQPSASVLTLDSLQRIIDAITTDRRVILARDLGPFRKVPGWALERAKGEPGWWFRSTSGRAWRIKVYRSVMVKPPKGSVYLIDPDAKTAPVRLGVGAVLATVTALALAGVDAKVDR